MISVVLPTLNAAAHLPRTLASLLPGVTAGLVKEAIVSDGGSNDATVAIAEASGCSVLHGERGRGRQVIAGAAAARGEWLLFLHADTALDAGWEAETGRFIDRPGAEDRAATFRFAFDDESFGARWIGFWVGVRCAALKLPYGDQGLLISRALYDRLGGYRAFDLMEDVDLVRRIGGKRLAFLKTRAITSAEKYRRDGYGVRAARNLWLIARYLMGAPPAKLAKAYD